MYINVRLCADSQRSKSCRTWLEVLHLLERNEHRQHHVFLDLQPLSVDGGKVFNDIAQSKGWHSK